MADLNTSGVPLTETRRALKRRKIELEIRVNETNVFRLENTILEKQDEIENCQLQIAALKQRQGELAAELTQHTNSGLNAE